MVSHDEADGWQVRAKARGYGENRATPNPQRGEVPIEIAGTIYYASINFDKAGRLIELFSEGGETTCNFGNGALRAWLAGDTEKISAALAILTGLTIEEVYQGSPAWEPSFKVISTAYNLFFFGTATSPEDKEEEGREKAPLAEESIQHSRIANFLSWLVRARSRSASPQVNSGPPPSMRSKSTSEHAQS